MCVIMVIRLENMYVFWIESDTTTLTNLYFNMHPGNLRKTKVPAYNLGQNGSTDGHVWFKARILLEPLEVPRRNIHRLGVMSKNSCTKSYQVVDRKKN